MRNRCTWETKETCKMYELQKNEYEEIRILMFGKVFKRFTGFNKNADAKSFWKTIKTVNGVQ